MNPDLLVQSSENFFPPRDGAESDPKIIAKVTKILDGTNLKESSLREALRRQLLRMFNEGRLTFEDEACYSSMLSTKFSRIFEFCSIGPAPNAHDGEGPLLPLLDIQRSIFKIVNPDMKQNSRFLEIARDEAGMQKRFQGIAPTVFAADDDWIDMENVRGLSGYDLLSAFRDCDDSLRVLLGLEFAHVLMVLERSHVTHGDFKPDNCIVDTTGRVRLLDFAGAFDEKTFDQRSTLSTTAYSPPEWNAGETLCDGKIDVFALGATLFSLFSTCYGKTPYQMFFQDKASSSARQKPDEKRKAWAHVKDDDFRLLLSTYILNQPMRKLISSMLRVDPDKRPSRTDVFCSLQTIKSAYAKILGLPELDRRLLGYVVHEHLLQGKVGPHSNPIHEVAAWRQYKHSVSSTRGSFKRGLFEQGVWRTVWRFIQGDD